MGDGNGEQYQAARDLAWQLIVEGCKQDVYVKPKAIFVKIMDHMDGPEPTFYYDLHREGTYQARVSFVVPADWSATLSDDPTEITGEICSNMDHSEASAVKKAFIFLATKHRISIIDLSTKICEMNRTELKKSTKQIRNAFNSAQYMVEQWESSLMVLVKERAKIDQPLVDQEMSVRRWLIYHEVVECLSQANDEALKFLNDAREGLRKYEEEMTQFTEDSNVMEVMTTLKRAHRSVAYTEVDTLSFVLDYLGLDEARYSNRYEKGDVFSAEVEMYLPKLETIRCGGTTKVPGDHKATAELAEKSAALSAVDFLERNYKITVIDLHYPDRDASEKDLKFMTEMGEKLKALTDTSATAWKRMIAEIKRSKKVYGIDFDKTTILPVCDEQSSALLFCVDILHKIDEECEKRYKKAEARLDSAMKLKNA